jgi:hypothetical protein
VLLPGTCGSNVRTLIPSRAASGLQSCLDGIADRVVGSFGGEIIGCASSNDVLLLGGVTVPPLLKRGLRTRTVATSSGSRPSTALCVPSKQSVRHPLTPGWGQH